MIQVDWWLRENEEGGCGSMEDRNYKEHEENFEAVSMLS